MMIENNKFLFEQWEEFVIKESKGKLSDKLVWEIFEGIAVKFFYIV